MNENELYEKVTEHEKRIGTLETQFDGLDVRVDSLEKWMPILLQDNKDTLRIMNDQINTLRTDVKNANDIHREIVKDAASRVPKWAMWLYSAIAGFVIMAMLGGAGWIVEAVIYHH